MNVKQLDKAIEKQLAAMESLVVGSDEHRVAADVLGKLIDRRNEMKRINVDALEKKRRYELDVKFKEDEFEFNKTVKTQANMLEAVRIDNEKKSHIWSNVLGIAGIVVPTVVTIWGTIVTLKFEETGTVTTAMGRGFINKLLPKK